MARAVVDPDNIDAEFGIVLRSDLTDRGLGARLLGKLADHLLRRGTQAMTAAVLAENRRMPALAQGMGFAVDERTAEGAWQMRLLL